MSDDKGKSPVYILDAAGLFKVSLIDSKKMFTTNKAMSEIKSDNERAIVNYYIKNSVLKIMEPETEALNVAINFKRTNPNLSDTDISIMAIALQLNKIYDVTVITDDYELQNALAQSGIKFKGIKTIGIKKIIKWTYRCTGCGKYFKEPYVVCPYCGSKVKRKPKKIKPA
ncbi:MAG: hypothetical protein ACP5NC_05760 [Nitrososphaeria archaeon]